MPFVGPNLLSAAITMNKAFTSYLLKSLGFLTPKLYFLHNTSYSIEEIVEKIAFPCIVKPNDGGSSFGISKVKKYEELALAISLAFESSKQVIVEEFIDGKEYSGGVSDFSGSVKALPITALEYESEFFDFSAKYEGKSREITPAPLSEEITIQLQKTLENIYIQLNLSGTVRVDFMLQKNKKNPYIIEINSIPGMTAKSMIPQQLQQQGITMEQFVNEALHKITSK